MKIRSWILTLALVIGPPVALAESSPEADSAAIEFFEKKIRPLLADNCYTCHSADTNSQGGLRVDDRNGCCTAASAARPSSPATRKRAC